MKTLFQIIESFFNLLVSILEYLVIGLEHFFSAFESKNKEYKADFAHSSSVLSTFNFGFRLTGRSSLTLKRSYENAIIIGSTGLGKSTVVLVPSLFSMRGSFIVNDPSGELFTKSAGYLKRKGYEVKLLNYSNPSASSGYNPLSRANSSSEIQKVASLLIENALGGKGKDPFWNTQAVALLSMLISILKKQEAQYQNLFNVRQLLNNLGGKDSSVNRLFAKYADEVLYSEYKSFLLYDEKVKSGVTATCKAALQIFSDESIAKITSFDTLDFTEFRNKPTVLFINNSVADQKYYSVITSIFFEQFFNFLLSRFPKKQEQDIFLLIDEASSLRLPSLPLAVANVRKHRSGIMLLLQDFNQLVHLYGKFEADGIKANCFAKMYFTGTSLETAKELEQTLGKYEYEDKDKRKVVRSLMTNDEIRTMKASQALLICGNNRPIKARLKPFYKRREYKQWSEIPAPDFTSEIPFIPLAVLPSTPKPKKEIPTGLTEQDYEED